MLITFSHDYNGQKVSRGAHAAIVHPLVEDCDDLYVLFVEADRQTVQEELQQAASQPDTTA